MKKQNQHLIERQIRLNINLRSCKRISNPSPQYKYTSYIFPNCVDLHNNFYREDLLRAVNAIKTNKCQLNRPYFDFSNVKVLTPMATIHFKQILDKYKDIVCRGRPSPNTVVSGMLSKLDIHKRIGFSETISNHNLVERWYTFSGENADFGDEYDEIENVLKEKFGEDSETFDVINTAIGEAVINVVNHAYDENDTYKKWYLFLSITPDRCNVVISDLGRTIPKTIPTKITDGTLERIFNVESWLRLKDDSKIEIATEYQKTATELPNRGKGFQDMKAVCDQIKGSVMMVHSRKGYWAKGNLEEKRYKKQNYKTIVDGTIVSWLIPLNNSSISVSAQN
ncbi:ATP-binding protein [Acinetobacter pittii]|uniref:ATP-binding protein n=1 Tax=Acinetobacter pittii TaxID=48296 RepID=UPI00202F68FC|nr:ATP-binding protein [Acinetobacter pittii]MCM1961989.1 ATP-binding protein [Acinetobacter pittii]MCM1978100.1 ATP-binding protein [Acinetobacter pittii]